MAPDSSSNVTLSIPCCGLANRVRSIIGAVLLAEQSRTRTLVVWQPAAISGAQYGDLFEPHPAFSVVDWRQWREPDDASSRSTLCYDRTSCVDWLPLRAGEASADWTPRDLSGRISKADKRERRAMNHSGVPDRPPRCDFAPYNYAQLFDVARVALPDPRAAPPPTVLRGCGLRFADATRDPPRCASLAHGLVARRDFQLLVAAALPEARRVVGVHLRPPDAEMDVGKSGLGPSLSSSAHASRRSGARRLSQGTGHCHPVELYARLVAEEIETNRLLTTVYVASGSMQHLHAFTQALHTRLSSVGFGGASASARPLPRVLSLRDLAPSSPMLSSLPAELGGRWARADGGVIETVVPAGSQGIDPPGRAGGRDSVAGMQGALLDLWALASTSKVFRSGESTFGMLASVLHHRPAEVVVREAACKRWAAMGPDESTGVPAFCAASRGGSAPKRCPCALDG